jgi:hypothetical protein
LQQHVADPRLTPHGDHVQVPNLLQVKALSGREPDCSSRRGCRRSNRATRPARAPRAFISATSPARARARCAGRLRPVPRDRSLLAPPGARGRHRRLASSRRSSPSCGSPDSRISARRHVPYAAPSSRPRRCSTRARSRRVIVRRPMSRHQRANTGRGGPATRIAASRARKGFRPSRRGGARGEKFWCEWGDSNSHGVTHWYLKPARLPIPPHSRTRAQRSEFVQMP